MDQREPPTYVVAGAFALVMAVIRLDAEANAVLPSRDRFDEKAPPVVDTADYPSCFGTDKEVTAVFIDGA